MSAPLTSGEAARYLGVSTSTLWRARKRRQIAYINYPLGGVRFEIAALDEFMRRCTFEVRVLSSRVRRLSSNETKSIEEARIRRAMREVQKERA